MNPRPPRWQAWLAAAVAVGLLAFSISRAMERGLNHDEHQFVVPAALFAHGSMPYRDYPAFHLPNLTYLYAAIFSLHDHKLLLARGLCALCAWLTALLVGWIVFQKSGRRTFLPAALATVLLIGSPLALHTAGKSWNHDVAALLAVMAFAFLAIGAQRSRPRISLLLSGLCIGGAIGTRLTFAPLAVPLGLMTLLVPARPLRHRIVGAALFSVGILLALLPTLHAWAVAPDAFLFGNFEFPRLGLLDPTNERIQKTMTFWRKLRFFFKEIAVTNWPLFAAFGAAGIPFFVRNIRAAGIRAFEPLLLGGMLLAALAGCFAPSRYQVQHYYVVAPFLAIAVGYGVSEMRNRWQQAAVTVLACAAAFVGIREYARCDDLARPRDWAVVEAHQFGIELREKLGPGKLLTLAPIFAVEGGVEIYPEFATAPFGWRSARLVAPERRPQLHLVAPDDLESFLEKEPPAGILVGVEDGKLEKPLLDYALAHRYVKVKLSRKKAQLWTRPPAPDQPPMRDISTLDTPAVAPAPRSSE